MLDGFISIQIYAQATITAYIMICVVVSVFLGQSNLELCSSFMSSCLHFMDGYIRLVLNVHDA